MNATDAQRKTSCVWDGDVDEKWGCTRHHSTICTRSEGRNVDDDAKSNRFHHAISWRMNLASMRDHFAERVFAISPRQSANKPWKGAGHRRQQLVARIFFPGCGFESDCYWVASESIQCDKLPALHTHRRDARTHSQSPRNANWRN